MQTSEPLIIKHPLNRLDLQNYAGLNDLADISARFFGARVPTLHELETALNIQDDSDHRPEQVGHVEDCTTTFNDEPFDDLNGYQRSRRDQLLVNPTLYRAVRSDLARKHEGEHFNVASLLQVLLYLLHYYLSSCNIP